MHKFNNNNNKRSLLEVVPKAQIYFSTFTRLSDFVTFEVPANFVTFIMMLIIGDY